MSSKPSVAVIGLGDMGAALAAALKQSNAYHKITGLDKNPAATEQALAHGAIDRAAASVDAVVEGADWVILATYVRHIIATIHYIGPRLKAGAVIMDVGSTKAHIVEAMNALPAHVQAIGGHPMTGKQTAQMAKPDPAMYRDRPFILTPTERTSPSTLDFIQSALQQIGARVRVMDARRHDELVGLVSHLPRLLASAIMQTALDADDELVFELAAGSFRDSTRAATENLPMWSDIFATNPAGLSSALRSLIQTLSQFAEQIEVTDETSIQSTLHKTANQWHTLFD